MIKTPRKHQVDALEYARKTTNPAFVMEMRLGKTLVAIRWAQEDPGAQVRCLVVAPMSVMEAWQSQLDEDGETYFKCYQTTKKEFEFNMMYTFHANGRIWVLMNYEKLRSYPEIAFLNWDYVFLDESTRIKNPKAAISQICVSNRYKKDVGKSTESTVLTGFKNAKHRAILTGLITPESELELFQQMAFLDGHFMGCTSYWQFRAKYFQPAGFGDRDWVVKFEHRDAIKQAFRAKAFVLRRQEAGMAKEKVYETISTTLTSQQKKLYDQILEDYAWTGPDGEEHETFYAVELHMWLQRICGGFMPDGKTEIACGKYQELLNLLQENLRGEQAVIWFKFRSELSRVRTFLEDNGISTCEIHGMVTPRKRIHVLQRFRGKTYRVMLATEKCAKYGIDCSTASAAIYFSNEPSCEDRVQSEDRILHMDTVDPLLYIDMTTKGCVDEDLSLVLQDKSFDARMFMTNMQKMMDKKLLGAAFNAKKNISR